MGRWDAIGKILGIAAEDAAKIPPEILREQLTKSTAGLVKDSKALGNTTHLVPDAMERLAQERLLEAKPAYGKIDMRAAAAMPTVSMGLGDQLDTLKKEVAQPLSNRWEQLKSSVYGPLSKQMNLSKDPEQAKTIEKTLNMVADPTNLIGGAAGAGLAGLQMLGTEDKEKKK